jgi:hypothetical protein
MTTLEKVEKALEEVNYMLSYKFITDPVRDSLTDIKSLLESIKADLS